MRSWERGCRPRPVSEWPVWWLMGDRPLSRPHTSLVPISEQPLGLPGPLAAACLWGGPVGWAWSDALMVGRDRSFYKSAEPSRCARLCPVKSSVGLQRWALRPLLWTLSRSCHLLAVGFLICEMGLLPSWPLGVWQGLLIPTQSPAWRGTRDPVGPMTPRPRPPASRAPRGRYCLRPLLVALCYSCPQPGCPHLSSELRAGVQVSRCPGRPPAHAWPLACLACGTPGGRRMAREQDVLDTVTGVSPFQDESQLVAHRVRFLRCGAAPRERVLGREVGHSEPRLARGLVLSLCVCALVRSCPARPAPADTCSREVRLGGAECLGTL